MAEATGNPTDSKGAEVYARLFDAVVDAVYQYGYAGATMVRIAEHAGFTRGAIQHYFGNRRVDMITRVTRELLAERQQSYETVYGTDKELPPIDSRAAMKAAYRDPRTWFLIEVWIAAKGDAELNAGIGALQDEIETISDTLLQAGTRQFGDIDFTVLKAFFRSLTRGIALEYSRDRNEHLFDAVVDLAFDALDGANRTKLA